MVTDRTRNWLLEHPEVLTFLFLVLLWWEEHIPDDVTIQGGAGGYAGP